MIRWSDFKALVTEELKLCKVREGETVIVLSQANDRTDYADAFVTAAMDLGATAYNLRLGESSNVLGGSGIGAVGRNPLTGNEAALQALESADLVIDLVFLLWSPEQQRLQDKGARVLMAVEPVDMLAKLFPTEDQTRRVDFSVDLLRNAKSMRITSRAGTDVTYELGKYNVLGQRGFVAEPGGWDHWPSGFCLTAGADVNGRVVVDQGDIIAAPFGRYVQDPIDFTIEGGMVTSVKGGVDAQLLRDHFAGFNDPRGYAISHIGWGVNENARWSSEANRSDGFGQESRAYYGNVMFSLGPNLEVGGDNDTPAHADLPMRGCSVHLDGEPIMIDGDFVVDELRVEGAALPR